VRLRTQKRQVRRLLEAPMLTLPDASYEPHLRGVVCR
jgi:hypothetical protein